MDSDTGQNTFLGWAGHLCYFFMNVKPTKTQPIFYFRWKIPALLLIENTQTWTIASINWNKTYLSDIVEWSLRILKWLLPWGDPEPEPDLSTIKKPLSKQNFIVSTCTCMFRLYVWWLVRRWVSEWRSEWVSEWESGGQLMRHWAKWIRE